MRKAVSSQGGGWAGDSSHHRRGSGLRDQMPLRRLGPRPLPSPASSQQRPQVGALLGLRGCASLRRLAVSVSHISLGEVQSIKAGFPPFANLSFVSFIPGPSH